MTRITPSQILYLEYGDARLYAEAIQTADRHRLWARPLMLVAGLPRDTYQRQGAIASAAADLDDCQLHLYDLDFAPDLVWPVNAFQVAFDTDFFSLLFHLKMSGSTADTQTAQARFNRFLQDCWQTDSTRASPMRS
jgi:hypothetical protein